MDQTVALVGLGYWGKNILRNLDKLQVLKVACDSRELVLLERKAAFPGVNFTTSFDEVLADKGVKAIVMATPAVTHYEMVKKALTAGKDVLVEKPLALTVEQGQELVKMAKELKRVLMVGHILRYHSALIKLQDMVRKGELGRLQYIYSNRLNIGKLRVEENIIWSFAPHDISVILSLVGEEPVKVGGFGGNYLTDGVFDVTMSTLEFRNKVKAHVFVSWLHPFKEQKLVVVGSEAMAVFDDVATDKLVIYPHRIRWEEGRIPVADKAEHYSVPFENKEPLSEELKHFVDCVATRRAPLTDGEEGLRVLKVLHQMESAIG